MKLSKFSVIKNRNTTFKVTFCDLGVIDSSRRETVSSSLKRSNSLRGPSRSKEQSNIPRPSSASRSESNNSATQGSSKGKKVVRKQPRIRDVQQKQPNDGNKLFYFDTWLKQML